MLIKYQLDNKICAFCAVKGCRSRFHFPPEDFNGGIGEVFRAGVPAVFTKRLWRAGRRPLQPCRTNLLIPSAMCFAAADGRRSGVQGYEGVSSGLHIQDHLTSWQTSGYFSSSVWWRNSVWLVSCYQRRQIQRTCVSTVCSCGTVQYLTQGLSQDLETGCPKLAIIKFWVV